MKKEIKKGDVMEVVDRLFGHVFRIGETVTIYSTDGGSGEYECWNSSGEYWYLDAKELSHIKTETK